MKTAPFRLTKEAEGVIRSALASTKEGMEPALGWATFLGTYEGPMVVLGHWNKNERPRDSFFEVCGYAVSILPSTLEHIEGKTISCEQVELTVDRELRHAYVFKVG